MIERRVIGPEVLALHEEVPEHLIELMEEERKRMARDIHDGPAQSLTNVTMRLEIVNKLLELQRIDDAQREIVRLQQLIRGAVNDARRMMFELHPPFLEAALVEAVGLYAERFSQTFDIPVHVDSQWSPGDLSHAVSVTLFRVYQEALLNVYEHARASEVVVVMSEDERRRTIAIRDNGCGFDPSKFGLRGMRERATLIGAQLVIHSRPGEGTTVTIDVPIGHHGVCRS